jgi:hypothetical protein
MYTVVALGSSGAALATGAALGSPMKDFGEKPKKCT